MRSDGRGRGDNDAVGSHHAAAAGLVDRCRDRLDAGGAVGPEPQPVVAPPTERAASPPTSTFVSTYIGAVKPASRRSLATPSLEPGERTWTTASTAKATPATRPHHFGAPRFNPFRDNRSFAAHGATGRGRDFPQVRGASDRRRGIPLRWFLDGVPRSEYRRRPLPRAGPWPGKGSPHA
jgi:hypothetical protein